jgi:hypothetical protein
MVSTCHLLRRREPMVTFPRVFSDLDQARWQRKQAFSCVQPGGERVEFHWSLHFTLHRIPRCKNFLVLMLCPFPADHSSRSISTFPISCSWIAHVLRMWTLLSWTIDVCCIPNHDLDIGLLLPRFYHAFTTLTSRSDGSSDRFLFFCYADNRRRFTGPFTFIQLRTTLNF